MSGVARSGGVVCCFFFKDTTHTERYTYCHTHSLHDALPILPIVAGARWLLPVTPSQARGDERRSGRKPPKSLSPSNVDLPACLEGFPKQAENLQDRKSNRLNSRH